MNPARATRGALALVLAALAVAWPAAVRLPSSGAVAQEGPAVETFLSGLRFPTNMAFAPDGRLFFTEKETGRLRVVVGGRLRERPVATLDVEGGAEMGLLGVALHPRFEESPEVFLYFTEAGTLLNRLVRLRLGDDGARPEPVMDLLSSPGIHNGGDMTIGADGMLYLVLGDAAEADRAPDPGRLNGKVLRLAPDGSPPQDNPFGPDNPVFSVGHRNSFGLCVNPVTGDLWETENGPSRYDEVNVIFAGRDYGWPSQLGPGGDPDQVDPAFAWEEIVVPTGCAFFDRPLAAGDPHREPGSTLYVGDFEGALHRLLLAGPALRQVDREEVVATFDEGITDLAVGPDGALYVATSGSILRIEGVVQAGSPSPTSSPATSAPATTIPSEEEDAGERGRAAALAVAALVALALVAAVAGVAFRLWARRRPPGTL
ncbi:MAG: PQQ-dependent sugar dehydrogenase [Actinobacteria bacterium]|nr:PQQ-dependent sugar dehydrogenase [Actinomycetota bacterium]